MSFLMFLPVVLFLGTVFFLGVKAVRNFRCGRKKQGFVFVTVMILVMYGTFHRLAFGKVFLSGDKWSVSVQNNSSIEKPEIILDFKNLYVHDKIKLSDWGLGQENRGIYGDYDENGFAGTSFYTKNSGYEFNKIIVPKGIKAEVSGPLFDFGMKIVLEDE